jgi:hypothetical protein
MASLPAPTPIPLASVKGKKALASSEQLINSFAELSGEGNNLHAVVLGIPGLTLFDGTPVDPCRGLYQVDPNTLLRAQGQQLWVTNAAGTTTLVNSLPGTSKVYMVRNAAVVPQTAIVSDGLAYVYQSGALSLWPDLDLPQGSIKGVIWLNGFFLFALADGRFFWSGLNSTSIDALDFATAEADPDGLVGIARMRLEIYLIGTKTIEVWSNVTSSSNPFERLPGAVIQSGCSSMATVADQQGRMYWLDDEGVVQRQADGYNNEPVSNREVYDAIRTVSDRSLIRGFAFTTNEHFFYALWHSSFTYVFDAGTGAWHQRKSPYVGGGWRCNAHEYFNGRSVFGNALDGKVGYLDEDSYTEYGDEIVMDCRFPRVDTFPQGGSVQMLELELQTGVGIDTGSPAPGTDTITPNLSLYWSDDGGETYKGGRIVPIGRKANWRTRVRVTQLGAFGSKGRVWRVTCSSKVFTSLFAAQMRATPLDI